MKLILDIWVSNTAAVAHHTIMRKQLETSVVPPPGVHYEDPQWSDNAKVPTAVILNLEHDYCLLQFEADEYASEEQYDVAMDAYRANGWRRASEWR